MTRQPEVSCFIINDLCCITEEMKLRKKLQSMTGIHSLQVNFISHRLTVYHSIDEQEILTAIRSIGFSGIPERADGNTLTRQRPLKQILSVSVSGGFFLCTLIATLFHADFGLVHILALASMITGGWRILWKALQSLRTLSLDINMLMSVAAIGAVLLDQYTEGSAVIFLFSLSLLLESLSILRTRQAIDSLFKLSPSTANVKRNNEEIIVPVDMVEIGEVMIIRPGERIALDGIVIHGNSYVNQAPITGESLPVLKEPGEITYAGSFNQNGALEIRTTKIASDTTLAHIVHLVEKAQIQKSQTHTFIEKFTLVYTPAVFSIALLIAFIPSMFFGLPFNNWAYRALVLLVISCPCAFSISTPISIVSAITNAARNGLLIKGGKHLESLSNIRALAIDKTGTVTHGNLQVTDVMRTNSLSESAILQISAQLEIHSEHHLADAFHRKASEYGLTIPDDHIEQFEAIQGKGIRATINGKQYTLGNHQLAEDLGICSVQIEQQIALLEKQGKTVVLLSDGSSLLGIIALSDSIRADGKIAIASLKRLGINPIVLLTGDNARVAKSVATELGIEDIQAELLPENKVESIRKLKAAYGSVAMIGDGINDAPALAAADIGIAMGGIGSDSAIASADIVLMSENLEKIPYGVNLGRKTTRIIQQNVMLALGTKAVFMALGIFGLTTLWAAILADDGVTLAVILNALRLLRTNGDNI